MEGGFTAGSSQELPSYDGERLAKKGDVVVVSINHRLNILGFLDLSAYGDKYKAICQSEYSGYQGCFRMGQNKYFQTLEVIPIM